MKRLASYLALMLMGAGAVSAESITTALIPKPRPQTAVVEPPFGPLFVPVFGPTADTVRPRPRPGSTVVAIAPAPVQTSTSNSAYSVVVALRPQARPTQVAYAPAPAPVLSGGGKVQKICGNNAILGRKVSPIQGTLKGCGVSNPVEVYSVGGVELSPPAVMTCDAAKALNKWVNKGVKPAIGSLGGGPAKFSVAAGYSCRTRNNQPGAKVSEHGKGKAIDISQLTLVNGKTLNVLSHWGKGAEGQLLAKMHKSACGPFGTVLGPNADKYHKDHFHFDVAKYGNGAYCR